VYYDIVHELAPCHWVYGYDEGLGRKFDRWEKLQAWFDEIGPAIHDTWDEIAPDKQCIVGQDTSFFDTEQLEWLLSREYIDLAIYGRVHRYYRAKA